MNRWKHWMLLGLLLAGRPVAGQTNGIFADFSTTKGAFTVWLDYERAPRAVASFVGLATGDAGWRDPQGNVWHKPYYDGTLIHRIPLTVDTNGPTPVTNRWAIQGGGQPFCGISLTNLAAGPATTDGFSFSVTTTNPPGVTTNDFLHGLVPFITENAAAVPTNYTYGGGTAATNAQALTRTVIYLAASASNAAKYVVNSYSGESWYTNCLPVTVDTTNWATIYTVTTNAGPGNEVLLHRVQLSMAYTSTILGPVVNTNFANAGYYMRDQSTNGLLHTNGAISMANSGPNTDGSQFFIMVTNNPGWDGSYTVFGHVTTGMNVVTSIAAVAVQGEGARPVADIVLSNVVIRRVGAAAGAFNIVSQGVPAVSSAVIRVSATGLQANVTVEIPAFAECRFRVSTNGLENWSMQDWGYFTNAAPHNGLVGTNTGNSAFFHAALTVYPEDWTAPTGHAGRVFDFYWETTPVTHYRAAFTNAVATWEKTQGTNNLSGNIFGFPYAPVWTHFPYSAKFYFADNLAQYSYSLWFDPGKTTNRFTGTMLPWAGGIYALGGTFTVQ